MKRITFTLTFLMLISAFALEAQKTNTPQINNEGFETWNNVGAATEEPAEWSSFKTASGAMAAFVSQQLKHSLVTRPGSPGDSSCVLWSKSVLGIVANGVVTTGRVNAGSAIATDPSNYNITLTTDPLFSEALGGSPDSLVVWVRFKPSNTAGTDSARIRAIIHDTYDFRDPSDVASQAHIVASATLNFCTTNNQWVRKSIPFIYSGPATSPDFMLINMTTNKTPGSGSAGDSLYIDDLSLVYSDDNVYENDYSKNFNAYADASNIIINLTFDKQTTSTIAVYNINGQLVYNNRITLLSGQEKVNTNNFVKGIYLVSVVTENGLRFSRKISVK
jgi:hypothetical protein